MYAPLPNGDVPLSQGDIIDNVILAYVPDISNPGLVLNDEYIERDLTQPFDDEEAITVVAQALKSPVLVIEPNCNIDHDDFISLARIFPLSDPAYDQIPPTRPLKKAKHLVRHYQQVGVQPAVFYLQQAPAIGFPKSLVSFLELHTIQRNAENLAYLQRNRILRLTDEAIGDLQYRIGFFFGRYSVTTENYMLSDEERAALLPPHNAAQAEAPAE
jgi:hypothetical protein